MSEGTLEEYCRLYPALETGEQPLVNGLPVTVTRQGPADSTEIFYTFQHPTNEHLRVTIHDLASGFPSRATGNNILRGVVQRVVSTFTFDPE